MPLSNIQVPVYLLLSTMLPGRKPSLVQREVPDFLYMDETTTAQDVINALIPKHLHPAQIPNYALYQTELVVPLNSTKMKDDVLQRQFSRALEPDEIPLFKVLHDIYTQPGKDKTFYIKKRDANETVSIFADLRRVGHRFSVKRDKRARPSHTFIKCRNNYEESPSKH